nr:hypothetical protein [Tanacetum cinerariifolium]
MAENHDILSSKGVIPKHWFVEEKMESAFLDVCWSNINDFGFIQFWAPVKIRERQLLSTYTQSYESAQIGSLILKYRLLCVRYAYSNYDFDTDEIRRRRPCNLIGGPVSTAFLNQLINALRRVGLTTLHVQECQTNKTIPSLKCARDEIEDALEILCESHNLTLAQIWIPYKIDNHDHVSSLGT